LSVRHLGRSADVHEVTVLEWAVDEGYHHHLVAERTSPLFEAIVWGRRCRGPLVPGIDIVGLARPRTEGNLPRSL